MSLLNREPGAPSIWPGDLPVTSRYTYGIAGERFFRMIKDEGKIQGTRCPHCEITYVPAKAFCERCLAELTQWVDVGKIGSVHTFTVLYVGYDGQKMDNPELIAFIQIADGGLIHRLGEVELEDVTIDMQVEAVFKPANERVGSIEDIQYFRPIPA